MRNRPRRHTPTGVPTKPNKALAAAITSLMAAVGVNITHGTAELVVCVLGVLVNAFAVWRTYNPPVRQQAARRG